MHKCIKNSNYLKEVQDSPIYSEEPRQLYKDVLEDLKIERQVRPEMLL